MAKTGLNTRFSDMYKAFQYIDTDRSGRLSKKEIARALDLWNIPLSDAKLDKMMAGCDQDDDELQRDADQRIDHSYRAAAN